MPTPTADTYTAASGATLQGGRGTPSSGLPTWVPTTAWQWTDIPGTIWNNYVKDDGTGVAPLVTALDPGPSKTYVATWDFSGPAYSRLNHELWMFGGGHAGTTINCVTKWRLNQDAPTVEMVCLPTTESMRNTYALAPNHTSYLTTAYWPDGKPYSPHSYSNNIYSDSLDEFISFGVSGNVSSADGGASLNGVPTAQPIIAGLSRAGAWRSGGARFTDFPAAVMDYQGDHGLRALAEDGSGVYYWVENQYSPRHGCNKYTFSTGVHALIGGAATDAVRCTNEYGGTVLICKDSQAAGWVGWFCSVSTGARTAITFTVNGAALASTMRLFDVMWVDGLGYYLAVWVNSGAINWPNSDGNLTSIVITKVTPTGSSTATVDTMSIATGSGLPTRCSAYRGAHYDPAFGCVILALSHSKLLKAIKVA